MQPEDNAVLVDFSNEYYDYTLSISARLKTMTSDELEFLYRAAGRVTPTNCWFATYSVAPLIQKSIQMERYRRQRATESADFSSATGTP